jgi:hypothetical protein
MIWVINPLACSVAGRVSGFVRYQCGLSNFRRESLSRQMGNGSPQIHMIRSLAWCFSRRAGRALARSVSGIGIVSPNYRNILTLPEMIALDASILIRAALEMSARNGCAAAHMLPPYCLHVPCIPRRVPGCRYFPAAFFSTSSIRVCQPGPVALKYSRTVGERRRDTNCLIADFCFPR